MADLSSVVSFLAFWEEDGRGVRDVFGFRPGPGRFPGVGFGSGAV